MNNTKKTVCSHCGGSGSINSPCPRCGGAGGRPETQMEWDPITNSHQSKMVWRHCCSGTVRQTCPICGGSGWR